jgi:hypothetical protein
MHSRHRRSLFPAIQLAVIFAIPVALVHAASVAVTPPPTTPPTAIKLGAERRPDGAQISVDSLSLLKDGRRFMPVMGEMHYSRYPKEEWREELLKMKAGGIDTVATYVFWIHHEEVEGKWDWTGNKNLHDFVALVGELGMHAVVRCGPWSHGECRNGGFPDWMLDNNGEIRSEDPLFMRKTRLLYGQIAGQLKGLLWKEGGPVIGLQHDNEYSGPATYLLSLKQMAQEFGLDVPLYTRTGWPSLATAMPYPQIIPLYGSYGDGFWDRELTEMPGNFWQAFLFSSERLDTATSGDRFTRRAGPDETGAAPYPYLTCEIWGGLVPAYHRRIWVSPQDVLSIPLVKLGSGGQMLGYYMYHGGTHPDGQLSTLMESQNTRTTNYNDLPVKAYDFNAPLGEFGQIRPQYGLLRRLHLFMHDYGEQLTTMPPYYPSGGPAGKSDAEFLRFSVRSDGNRGYIFVNNYQRHLSMPAKPQTRFEIKLPSGTQQVPSQNITVPADSSFFWPFNMPLGAATLVHATAQPLCRIQEGQTQYSFFSQTAGVPAEFVIDPKGGAVEAPAGTVSQQEGRTVVRDVKPGLGAALTIRASDGTRQVLVLLDEAASTGAMKARYAGVDRLFISKAGMIVDGKTLRLQSTDSGNLSFAVFPAISGLQANSRNATPAADGLFERYSAALAPRAAIKATVEQTKQAGPARKIELGVAGVAVQPVDADFDAAATWTIKLPAGTDPSRKLLFRTRYVGDVARYYLGGKLLTDDFYTGRYFDLGVNRFGPEIYSQGVTLKILPLRKDAPIYLERQAKPDFGNQESMVKVDGVEVIEEFEATFQSN